MLGLPPGGPIPADAVDSVRMGTTVAARIRLREPMTIGVLSEHRRISPYGFAGGAPGALGTQHMERADGTVWPVVGCDSVAVRPGGAFVWRTPDDGGYGPATPSAP